MMFMVSSGPGFHQIAVAKISGDQGRGGVIAAAHSHETKVHRRTATQCPPRR